MKQNIYKVFNHKKEYITKYIYDYDTLQERTLEESEETDNIDKQIKLLNENDKILKAYIESSFNSLLELINKKINNKHIFGLICIISFVISSILTYKFNHAFDVPNIMCLITFILSLIKYLDKYTLKEIKSILESYKK